MGKAAGSAGVPRSRTRRRGGVAELVNANAKFNLTVRRHYAVAFGHTPLDFGCTSQGIDHAGELDQQAIASGLDDAPAVFADFWVNQFAPMRLQPRERPFLVGTHEPAVTSDIGGENGGQPAFDAFRGQSGAPNRVGRIDHRRFGLILRVNAGGRIPFPIPDCCRPRPFEPGWRPGSVRLSKPSKTAVSQASYSVQRELRSAKLRAMSDRFEGSCLCGAVRFVATGQPESVAW